MKKLAALLFALLVVLVVAAEALGQSVGASQIKKKVDGGVVADSANALAIGVKRGTTAPASPVTGQLWLDTATAPATMKSWNGSTWEVSPTAAALVHTTWGSLPGSPTDGQIVWASTLKRAIVYDATAGKWYYLDNSGREAIPNYSLDAVYPTDFLATATTTGSVAAGGSVTVGTHVCATTFYNATGGETTPGASTGTLTASSGNQTLSLGVPTGGSGTVGRRVYCSKTGTEAPLFRVTTIADNTTTTYSVTVADASFADTAPDTDFSASLPSGWSFNFASPTDGGCGSTGTSLLCATYAGWGATSASFFGVRLTYEVSGPTSGWRARYRLKRASPGFFGSTENAGYGVTVAYVSGSPSVAATTPARSIGTYIGTGTGLLPLGTAGTLNVFTRAASAAWANGNAVPLQYQITFQSPLFFEVAGYLASGTYYGRISVSSDGVNWTTGTTWGLADELRHVGIAQEQVSGASTYLNAAVYEIDQFTVENF